MRDIRKGNRKRGNNFRAVEARAALLRAIRSFFDDRGFIEVETPIMVEAPGTDPHISAFETTLRNESDCFSAQRGARRYLHASPEFAMKKLLARGYDRIYQICKTFRDGESGPLHHPEFTMLEWYRLDADYLFLMDETEELVVEAARALLGTTTVRFQGCEIPLDRGWERISVHEAFIKYADVDLSELDTAEKLLRRIRQLNIAECAEDWSWEELFFVIQLNCVEPRLGFNRPTILYDYPASLAILSRRKPDDPKWAERFEVYMAGIELANAFSELVDPVEQRARFMTDLKKRKLAGKPLYPVDEDLLEALTHIESAAGIALGVDRLLMLLTDAKNISEVLNA